MRKLLSTITPIAAMILIGGMLLPTAVLAGSNAHALFCTCSIPADTAIVCGTKQKNRPYTLNVSATASTSAGAFRINFQDGDSMGFEVPLGSTYSTTHSLGGVKEVDTPSVKITAEGGVVSMMASVSAQSGDAFCSTIQD